MDLRSTMFNWPNYLFTLYTIGLFALLGWCLSLLRNNVTHVDSMWSLFFALATYTNVALLGNVSPRAMLVLGLVTIWALRLFVYLTKRNWGPHEDHRYSEIRANNQPNFWLKSIYIVFGLQAVLAWIISVSLFGAVSSPNKINMLDYLGAAIVLFGLIWETVADNQLSRFKAVSNNKDKVLATGLWKYSRHPNYFGECCVWWGFYVIAIAGGAWWAIVSPILMTLLLLKVSGVSLLEKTITERRPAYADYIRRTNTFFPGIPKA
jgi:steroid 5-alpha reductase family enzyme